MELQFHKTALPGLQLVKREVRNLEETQEIRISDEMPDVGRVLGAWGQVLLRSKEWRSGNALASGGVQVWVLYEPEEGGSTQVVETWIPFQMKWDVSDQEKDGIICACCKLRSADARSIASGKLMVRVNVGILGEMWMPAQTWLYTPGDVPEDIQLKKCTYPVRMPTEAGEKPFVLEEELTLPGNAPKAEKIMHYNLQPELVDRKLMSNKVVFRGACLLHILYRGEDGNLHTWDFELPFSQYSDLEREYEQGAAAQITPAVTSLDLDMDVEGRLRLKAGLTGQYMISDRVIVETVEDAYSPLRQVIPQTENIALPMILDTHQQTINAEQPTQLEGTAVDAVFYPDHPYQQQDADRVVLRFPGHFQMLYRDTNDQLQTAGIHWEGEWELLSNDDVQPIVGAAATGKPQTAFDGNGILLYADVLAEAAMMSKQGLSVVTGLDMGEPTEPDPSRPSMILRRAGENSLWELAKQSGSTVEKIMEANRLETDPDPERMLLIPVL